MSSVEIALIPLNARLGEDLEWKHPKELAKKALSEGKQLFWDMDLGLEEVHFFDPTSFFSLTLALEEFVKTLWKDYRDQTIGVSLFKGKALFSTFFIHDQEKKEEFLQWLEDLFSDQFRFFKDIPMQSEGQFKKIDREQFLQTERGAFYFNLFCSGVFSEYLHRLISFLPDSLQVFCLFDVSDISRTSELLSIFSKTRFEHVHLIFKGNERVIEGIECGKREILGEWLGQEKAGFFKEKTSSRLGVCIPLDEMCYPDIFTQIDQTLEGLKKKGMAFRILSEAFLTEEWEDIDFLIVFSHALSPHGKRKIQGFCASGGTVLVKGSPLGLSHEMPYERWEIELEN